MELTKRHKLWQFQGQLKTIGGISILNCNKKKLSDYYMFSYEAPQLENYIFLCGLNKCLGISGLIETCEVFVS